MSWELEGKVFVKGKKLFDINMNNLKSINTRGYDVDLMYIEPIIPADIERKYIEATFPEGEEPRYKVLDFNSVLLGLNKAKEELKKSQEKFDKLESIRYTKEFYSFDDQEKANYWEDMDYTAEVLEEYKWEVEAIEYTRDLFITASNIFDPEHYECNDVEDVKLCLYAN